MSTIIFGINLKKLKINLVKKTSFIILNMCLNLLYLINKEKNMRKFEIVKDEFVKYDNKDIKMPERATKHSVVYDFCIA